MRCFTKNLQGCVGLLSRCDRCEFSISDKAGVEESRREVSGDIRRSSTKGKRNRDLVHGGGICDLGTVSAGKDQVKGEEVHMCGKEPVRIFRELRKNRTPQGQKEKKRGRNSGRPND